MERIVKRSITIAGHRTSLSLEAAFWREAKRWAAKEEIALAELIRRIDAARGPEPEGGLSSAVRVAVLKRALGRARGQD